MKKQLNLICVLIFFFVGLSLLPSIYLMGNAFVDGFSAGMSQAEKVHEQGVTNISAEVLSPLALNLWPKSLAATSDKIFNQRDQEWYPASQIKTLVWVKSKELGITQLGGLLTLISLIFIVKAIIQFYKLINAINHEVIFDWLNVRRLNRIGRNLLISFVLTQAYVLMNYWASIRLFELEGYEHNIGCDFQSMTLIMGLIALLVGRIFAIGLQMKEEQELTI
ncbi:DUF2975 domain-containing protein [uncultured Parabacteroides sp.]|jgi:hypothetical protein|uniref:DUF2975 domain-containing protein n=2 Tax=Parabacteroides TaxID=375288 RepID=UPI00260082B7|nr:DUF2975 domain-containing protein [uncultured Parabacteroides sp.]